MSHDSPACLQRLESRLLLTAIYEIIDLGTLGGPSSTAAGLNASHQVVGQSLVDPSPARARAFIWDPAAGMTALDLIEGYTLDQAAAVADDGTAVGTARNAAFDERAVMWGEAGPVDLGTLGGAWSRGADVNETGQIVGTSALPEGGEPDAIETFHAFLWQDGIMTDLGTLGGTRSQAKAISDSGQVVGLSFPQDAPTFHAFSWQDGVMIDLGTLGGPASSAHDVSVSGLVVGDADLDRLDREGFNQYHAAVWREGRVTDLGTLGGEFSSALGINETGRIVGWSEMRRKDVLGQPVEHAFVYDHDGMRNLNDLVDDPAWTLHRATAINDEGYIAGVGTFEGGSGPGGERAFLLRPLRPDLTVRIGDVRLPDRFVPGDRGRVRIRIVNDGETDAYGTVPLEVRLSTDGVSADDDPVIATVPQRIRLRPGQGKSLRLRFEVPGDLPPGRYHLVAAVGAGTIDEQDDTNNDAVTDDLRELVWMFGQIDKRRDVRLTINDDRGRPMTFALRSAGTGQVTAGGDGFEVAIVGTTGRSIAMVTGPRGDEGAAVHDVHVEGGLRKWLGAGVDLTGSFVATAAVRELIADDLVEAEEVRIGSDGARGESASLRFDRVAGLNIVSQVSIRSLIARQWASGGDDRIEAPAILRLEIGGAPTDVFDVSLSISGVGVPAGQPILDGVDINGLIGAAAWSVEGPAGTIRVDGITADWVGVFAGVVNAIEIAGDAAGRLAASGAGRIRIGGDLHDAAIELGLADGAANTRRRARRLDRLTVGGLMRDVSVRSSGNLGEIITAAAERVDILAGVREGEVPDRVDDFDQLAAISRVTIRGQGREQASVIDMNVGAWTIGTVTVSGARRDPAAPVERAALNLAARSIRAVTYRGPTPLRLRRPDDFVTLASEDLSITIV